MDSYFYIYYYFRVSLLFGNLAYDFRLWIKLLSALVEWEQNHSLTQKFFHQIFTELTVQIDFASDWNRSHDYSFFRPLFLLMQCITIVLQIYDNSISWMCKEWLCPSSHLFVTTIKVTTTAFFKFFAVVTSFSVNKSSENVT